MTAVTFQVQVITKGGVDVCHAPRFLDKHADIGAVLSSQSVHASVKVGKLETISAQDLSNHIVTPIFATSRPLNEDGNTQRHSE
jgi:hypothetical protein